MGSEVEIVALDGCRLGGTVEGSLMTGTDVAVLLHGITTHRDEYANVFGRVADMLADGGMPSIRIDFRGHGRSSAAVEEFDISTQLIDILSTLHWVRRNKPGPVRYRILAASFAAPAAVVATRLWPDGIARLVLLAPVLDFDMTFVEPVTPWGRETFGVSRLASAIEGGALPIQGDDEFRFSRRLAVDLLLSDPRPALRRVECPVSILHGTADGMVPYAASVAVAETSPDVKLHSMPDTEHGLFVVGDDEGTTEATSANFSLLVGEMMASHGS